MTEKIAAKAKSKKQYTSESIEVLTGLEPVRKRPGMYTDTTDPNHLAQEVIDNSVDEAMAGFANQIHVVLYKDGALEVTDNGRGMPTDVHAKHKMPGVELILTRLHAGAKFSNQDYRFAGGLHGVGVSVVNALSKRLEVWIKRDGHVYYMDFEKGKRKTKLKKQSKLKQKESGTRLKFWPQAQYFDSVTFSMRKLLHLLKAKAVLCPGLRVTFLDESTQQQKEWYYEDGLKTYLLEQLDNTASLPSTPFEGALDNQSGSVQWAITWTFESTHIFQESYVNLIPTAQGGTHVCLLYTSDAADD